MSESIQSQTTQDFKTEADRLLNLGIKAIRASQYLNAIQFDLKALGVCRELKDRECEGRAYNGLALGHYYLGEYDRAIDYHVQRLAIARERKDRLSEGKVLGNLGVAYYSLGKYDKAIDFQLQSLAIARETKSRIGEGISLGNLGNAYYSLGKYDKAIEYHQQSLAIAREIKNRLSEEQALGNLGSAYEALGKYEKAIEFQVQSLVIALEIKDRLGEGQSLGNLGNAYSSLGKYEKAIEFQVQSLAIAREIKDRLSEEQALGNLGNAYHRLGKYEKAIEFHLQSLAIAREIKARLGEGQSLGNLGNAYYALGKYEKAIEFQVQSLVIAREIKDRLGEGQSLGNLGNAYNSLGKYEKAIEFHLQSLAIAREIKDRLGEGLSLGNLGIAYDSLGKYDKAVELQLQRLAIAREIKDRLGEGQSLGNLGNIYKNLGKYDKAIEFQLQRLTIAQEIRDRLGEGQSIGNLGIAYYFLGKYEKAIDYHMQFLAISQEIKNRDGEGISLNNLGATFAQISQPELAILFYKKSINVREAIRKDIRKLNKEEQRSYLETVSSSYKRLASLLLNQGRIMEALQILDLLKVQELEDYFKNIKGSDRSAQGVRLLEPEKAISDKLLAASFNNSKEINSQLANQIQQLPKSEINKVPDYLQKIPRGTVLLYPLILSDRLEMILFSPNSLPISRTVNISKDNLEKLVTEFRAALIDEGSEDYREPATSLYNLLIKPIEADLVQSQAKTILYAPDGILRYIPLAALYDGKQWLSEKYRVSNLIAYTLSDFSLKPNIQPNILAGAFGGKTGEKRFGQQSLPATLKEVEAIASYFPNSVTLLEDAFSRQAAEDKFKNHNILHFATHAEFNTGTPDNSFIIFGNGDKIRLSELTDWQIPNVELIVLSACQTGVGKLGTGVEILGFGYQVQKVGAKNAIASLWSVDDAGTQALMEAFYKELKKADVSPTESLNRAQISLIKSSKFNHPKYWSAFFVIGNGL
ncbi:CHAT domain-containing protein [Pseudanabaena sp. UWO311]|nr:tetratricopeptide repeat protein [Pseudanabaena sp. UWO311]